MLEIFFSTASDPLFLFADGLLIIVLGSVILYILLFYVLRSIFRRFERDIALVTLNVSAYPVLISFFLLSFKITSEKSQTIAIGSGTDKLLTLGLVVSVGYWLFRLFENVLIYYLKIYTRQSEVMWADVLLPLIEVIVPILIAITTSAIALQIFGIDLNGIWITLGGATFIIGFAVQDILANFFSGIVLLIDAPFQFGDVLQLEDGSLGMLRRIGVRVTHLYRFDNHCNIYIPNSVLQGQQITNLSRPTSYYYYSLDVQVPAQCELEKLKQVVGEILIAHPDTLGHLDSKLKAIEHYFQASTPDSPLNQQQEIGKQRLLAEQEVNEKLDAIDLCLGAMVVTLQFAEKGGLTQDEIENIQNEYKEIVESIGLCITVNQVAGRATYQFDEIRSQDTLISLVRAWYHTSICDPNLLDEDEEVIPFEWERRINLLKRRVQRLYQKILRPEREETRLDDYVSDLRKWMKTCFKTPRKKWQEPHILISNLQYEEGNNAHLNFTLTFFVDDIKLEKGKRGDRIKSQIYHEVIHQLKQAAVL